MEHASVRAQGVMNEWNLRYWAGALTKEFNAVHDLAFSHYLAKTERERCEKQNIRLKGQLDEEAAAAKAEEASKLRAFDEAYKAAVARRRSNGSLGEGELGLTGW